MLIHERDLARGTKRNALASSRRSLPLYRLKVPPPELGSLMAILGSSSLDQSTWLLQQNSSVFLRLSDNVRHNGYPLFDTSVVQRPGPGSVQSNIPFILLSGSLTPYDAQVPSHRKLSGSQRPSCLIFSPPCTQLVMREHDILNV